MMFAPLALLALTGSASRPTALADVAKEVLSCTADGASWLKWVAGPPREDVDRYDLISRQTGKIRIRILTTFGAPGGGLTIVVDGKTHHSYPLRDIRTWTEPGSGSGAMPNGNWTGHGDFAIRGRSGNATVTVYYGYEDVDENTEFMISDGGTVYMSCPSIRQPRRGHRRRSWHGIEDALHRITTRPSASPLQYPDLSNGTVSGE